MEIERIRIKIERALVDGRLSRQDSIDIKIALYAEKPVSPEAVKLFRELQERIWLGEIRLGD